ncbi:MAG: secretion protein [Burkholderiales bacterium RIFCSPLOWO2_12_FULL_61_40]|nr:MAG: secretion protein [Burkholderiales bacterium RIFCSPLOWO2_12_FULL_61_40]
MKRMYCFGKLTVCLAVMLCFSSLSWAQAQEKSFAEMVNKFALIPAGEPESEMLAKAAVAVNFIKRMELPQASKAINEALQLDARNTYLHFFNGFVYHLQARQGDTQKNEMAVEGYQQALRIDPSNWIAQEFLGLAYIDLKKFDLAKSQFADVLLLSPDSTVSIYGLMVASYMTGDPVTACAMADQFSKSSPEPHAGFIRSSVSVYASCGDFDKADRMRLALGPLNREGVNVHNVDRRLAQWKTFYRTRQPSDQLEDIVVSQASPSAADPGGARAPEEVNDGSPRMVLVDVVMVSTEESISTSKGINLLNALTLQLGAANGVAAYTENFSYNTGTGDASTAITRAVSIPALAYSLNIANANNSLNEVLARPTLAAIEGMPSEFFSGTNLNAAVTTTSTLGNAAIPLEKRYGVRLAVTPAFLANGKVQLKVDASRTFLNPDTEREGFTYRLEISETTANANVVMQLGDTLVLSGLSEKESSKSRTGVPGLQDVPVVQYLFSNQKKNDFQRSVLILITPRTPMYTSHSGRGQSPAAAEHMKALREQFGFAGKSPTNIESIFNHLKTTELFREFRQGDVSLERWDRMHSTGDRLRQALEFLYY